MVKHPIALAIALMLVTVPAVTGCEGASRLTEQERIQRAKDLEDAGDLRGGIIELKNAVQKNPDSAQARLLLGQFYLKAGLGAEAEKELGRAQQLGVSPETLKPQLGEALLMMGEYQRILDEIHPGERTTRPNLARIYQIRADAMLKKGQVGDACALFEESLGVDASNAPTYWGLAKCAMAKKDMPKARSLLDAALKIGKHQAKTWTFIGEWEQLNKNTDGALSAYSTALKAEPNNLGALQNRAALNLGLGRSKEAEADINKLTSLAPKSLASSYLLAMLEFERGNFPNARDHLQNVFKITSDHMPSIVLAGATDYELGSYKQAESHLVRYLARFPADAYGRRVLAATQIKQAQADQALQTLAPLLTDDSRDFQALALAAEAWRIKGSPGKVAEFLARASTLDPTNVFLQTQLGLTHLAAGENQLAIAELSKAASLDPTQHRADVLLITAYLERKEFDRALSAIDGLEKKLKNSPLPNSLRGSAYIGKKDYANARRSLEQALVIDPGFFPASASLAQLDIRDKKPEVAQKRFERILAKDNSNLPAMMALAELAAIGKSEKDYVTWLDKAAKAHPNAIAPRAGLVRHFLAKREPQKALPIANEALNANPGSPAALEMLGSVQLALGDTPSATSTFTKLARLANRSPDAHLRLATAQIAGGRLADARTSLSKALQIKPDHEASLDTLIKLEMKEGKAKPALERARQLQASHPGSPLGFEREGDILLSQQRADLAAKAYEQSVLKGAGSDGFIKLHRALVLARNPAAEQRMKDWLSNNPKDLAVQFYAAEYYQSIGRQQDAASIYQRLLTQQPDHAIALNNLATVYQRTGDKRARATAEQAFRINPDHPAILDTLGWILVEQGDAGRGLPLIERALAGMPGNPDIRYHRAIALAHKGDKVRARQELEALLKEAPTFSEAAAARAQLQRL